MIELIECCNLCGKKVSDNARVVAEGLFNHYGVKSMVHTMMCNNCKYVFQYERFDNKTLSFLYEQDSPDSFLKISSQPDIYQKNLIKRQDFILEAIGLLSLLDKKNLNILDVGGGEGEITEPLVEYGEVYLADVSTNDPVNPDIIKINKLFDDADFDEKFDVIVMNHVLEHVFSPMSYLEKANCLLKDQGVIIIEVPFELYTPLFKRLGDWKHVVYFSTNILRNFLLKSGFDPIYLKLTTGYYETRKLSVIRAIARKTGKASENIVCTAGYLSLFRDIFNLKALISYISSKIRKLLS